MESDPGTTSRTPDGMFDRVLFKKENTYLLLFARDPYLAEDWMTESGWAD
jgi:hypothetical protein